MPSNRPIVNFSSSLALTVLFLCIILISGCNSSKKEQYITINKLNSFDPANTSFTGTQACIQCHNEEYSEWKGSHHDQAMQLADSSSVLGNFNNVSYSLNGRTSTFFMRNGDYFVNTEGSEGTNQDFEIKYTFGVHPLQQYIVSFPKGQYQVLAIAWDSEENKWFSLEQNTEGEWMHWTGGAMRWNSMCADCHSTDLKKNFDEGSDSYRTRYSAINVSCEACHGPASAHVSYYEDPQEGKKPPNLYMVSGMSSEELVDKCARCHSRRAQISSKFDYSGDFLDHYSPELLLEPVYEGDGQIKDEDYVYGSFIQSKMYHNGVSCTDCHNVHSTKLKATGNQLCLTCHAPKYDEVSHHFHKKGTEASLCINCHMTGRTYMGNDFRRDHSFRIPRPDQTLNYGTPNACNTCHTDKDAPWASDAIIARYGAQRKDHFSDHLLAGSQGNFDALYHLIVNEKYPDIVRATALYNYVQQPLSEKGRELLIRSLQDPSPLVRNQAVLAAEYQDPGLGNYIGSLLQDPVRLVRISTAKYLINTNVNPTHPQEFAKAEKEFLEYLAHNSDFASGQTEKGLYHQARGEGELATSAYRKALKIDDFYNPARMNLALLLYTKGDIEGAKNQYLKVITQEPEFSYSYYMLGLLYNEIGESTKALEYLSLACSKDPLNIRACYNYALKLQEAEKYEESIAVMTKALEVQPDSEELLYVLLLGQLKSNQNSEAIKTGKRLMKIVPDNPDYQQILSGLMSQNSN